MKKHVFFIAFFSFSFFGLFQVAFTQAPQKFSYQAVARNGNTILADHIVDVRFSLLQGSETGSMVWEEIHNGISTNAYGLFSLQVGNNTPIEIDWEGGPYYLNVEIDTKDGNGYIDLGAQELASVPYALNASSVSTLKELNIEGAGTADPAIPLFEVKRPDGQTVFAVYADSIRMFVNATEGKGHKGGFAIGGFDAAKGIVNDYMQVTPDSVRIYIDQSAAKGHKGGFAIGGFDAAKSSPISLMHLSKDNYFIGHESGLFTTGLFNAFLGYQAGMQNTIGTSNIFLGYQAGMYNTIGNYNVFIGDKAGLNNTRYSEPAAWEGNFNCFIGNQTGMSNETGAGNTFIGNQAGQSNTTGSRNTFIGFSTGESNTTGSYNAFFGDASGWKHEDGINNTFVGYGAGGNAIHGDGNVYVGHETGRNMNPGNLNVMIGRNAAFWMDGGEQNTYVGAQTGYGASANRYVATGNVFLGYRAGFNETTSNKLYIENSGANSTGALIYGDFELNRLRLNANTGINYTPNSAWGLVIGSDGDDTYGLVVYGDTYCSDGTWAGSDLQLKKNVEPFDSGLENVLQLRGVRFEWKTEEFPDKGFRTGTQVGVIAQEVERVIPELVSDGPDGYKSVDYAKMSVILIEAIKDQQEQIEALKLEIDKLKNK